jgi:SAM-dependent methyltransferase
MTMIEADTSADAFAGRVFTAALGAVDLWSIYTGDKFGLYRALAESGPATRPELTERTGMHQRYCHEWLEQQVTSGILAVDDPTRPADERRYRLPEGHAEVLTDADSLTYLAPFVRLMSAAGVQLPSLLDAYRTGGGVSWAQFGVDMRTGQAEMNRPWFLSELGNTWFPAIPELHSRLEAGAAVADVGCGEGWSSIAIALAYPNVTVDGFDIDTPSIEAARRHAARAGVADRIRFHDTDAATLDHPDGYDVVTAFECIHDLPYPVPVLSTMRRVVKDGGIVLVMDEAVADAFGDRFDDVERLMYGFSLFICLPDGMSHPDSSGTGTVIRPATLKRYAESAGFSDVEVLPVDNELWRFYRLLL